MKLYNVGILGATGAVGQEMMKILLERKFPVGELRPIASARSAGSVIERIDCQRFAPSMAAAS